MTNWNLSGRSEALYPSTTALWGKLPPAHGSIGAGSAAGGEISTVDLLSRLLSLKN